MEHSSQIEASQASTGAPAAWKRHDSVTNGNQPMTAPKKTLDELIAEIVAGAKTGNERLLATAMLMRELRLRIEAGEAGDGVKWTQWALEKFGRGKTWLNELNAIANAKDPKAAVARYCQNHGERQKRYNESHIERDPVRIEVMKMIRSLNPNQVRNVRQYIWRTILN